MKAPAISQALPKPTPETQFFWDGTKQKRLLVQQCCRCEKTYFPPRPFCPKCGNRDVKVVECSGVGRLLSYIVNHRLNPKWKWKEPYSIAIVELAEGPRMLTNIVGCDQTPEALQLDMPLSVAFEVLNEHITIPVFEPQRNVS
jgi:uncharacterized OB-fold protein